MYNIKKINYYLNNILSIASPSGYTNEIADYIKEELHLINAYYYTTNKGSIVVTIKGENSENERTFSAHIDTLGAMVKEIKASGALGIVPIGGLDMNTVEGENCSIVTLFDKTYSGTIQTIKPSVHIYSDARTLKREAENMEIIIDEIVNSKAQVEALGISVGDFVCFDPKTRFTENGFVKSRHLDNKAGAAILMYAIKYIIENNIALPYDTNFVFTTYEEVGHGAASGIPENTKELIAIDMGAPGKGQNSSEYSVCICAKDSSGPYDYNLRKRLTEICINNHISYKTDIYPNYSSDASAALKAGYDVKTALIGSGIYASHGYERTHMDGILSTLDLVIKYSCEK